MKKREFVQQLIQLFESADANDIRFMRSNLCELNVVLTEKIRLTNGKLSEVKWVEIMFGKMISYHTQASIIDYAINYDFEISPDHNLEVLETLRDEIILITALGDFFTNWHVERDGIVKKGLFAEQFQKMMSKPAEKYKTYLGSLNVYGTYLAFKNCSHMGREEVYEAALRHYKESVTQSLEFSIDIEKERENRDKGTKHETKHQFV